MEDLRGLEFEVYWSPEDDAWIAKTNQSELLISSGHDPVEALQSLVTILEETDVEFSS